MEDELFEAVYRLIRQEPTGKRPRRCQYSDKLILLVFFWAVLNDRPVCWACNIRHWPARYQWLALPSQPTLSRRLRRLSLILLLTGLYHRLRQVPLEPRRRLPALVRCIDSRPLVVGGASKDRDARRGYAAGVFARGYKFAASWGQAVVPDAFAVGTLNRPDAELAEAMLAMLEGGGYLLADVQHDSTPLYERAAEREFQLLTPRQKPQGPVGRRRQSEARLRGLERMEGPSDFARQLYASLRGRIERDFGQWSSFGGGLQPLPSWVRHPRRVAMWVVAKLVLNGLRICRNKRLAA